MIKLDAIKLEMPMCEGVALNIWMINGAWIRDCYTAKL